MEEKPVDYSISFRVINRNALAGNKFSMAEVVAETIKNGGCARVGFMSFFGDYFREMESRGFFKHAGWREKEGDSLYLATEKFHAYAKALPNCVEDGLDLLTFENVIGFCKVFKEIKKDIALLKKQPKPKKIRTI